MGVELKSACSTCKEIFWLGSAKPYKWLGFQFGNRQAFSWFARHSQLECRVSIGNDFSSQYSWEVGLNEEEIERFKYMAYDLNTSQWKYVYTVEVENYYLDNDMSLLNYYPNLYIGDDQVCKPFTANNKPVNALTFDFDMCNINKTSRNEYAIKEIENFKHPLIIYYKDLTIEDITFEWAYKIYCYSSEFVDVKIYE